MKQYRPSYIMLCSKTPLDQCLCDKCENFEQLLKVLMTIGMKNIPSNRYHAVDSVVCKHRISQFGSDYTFPRHDCITGTCPNCRERILEDQIHNANEASFAQNRQLTWHKWVPCSSKSAPQKCQIHGTLRQAIQELLEMLSLLKSHIFRANWNRNIFDYS